MGIIVAIGGGEIAQKDTIEIDKEIISLSRKKCPHVIFISAASNDSEEYCGAFQSYYSQLGCDVKLLKLVVESPSEDEISSLLEWADIIYIGGGNTILLIETLKKYSLDTTFKNIFHNKRKVLCGLSAGALCWFEFGMSDSIPGKWIFVPCLGILEGCASVGFLRQDNRKYTFLESFSQHAKKGTGIDDRGAVIVQKDKTILIKEFVGFVQETEKNEK